MHPKASSRPHVCFDSGRKKGGRGHKGLRPEPKVTIHYTHLIKTDSVGRSMKGIGLNADLILVPIYHANLIDSLMVIIAGVVGMEI